MARITFGQITLEDPNKSLQELVQIYKGLFINEEFALPFISTSNEEPDIEEEFDEDDEVEEEVQEEPQTQANPEPTQTNASNNMY